MFSQFLTMVVSIMALRITVIDIRYHRIQNRDLLAITPFLALSAQTIDLLPVIAITLVTILVSLLIDLGGGDLKLLILLFLTQGELVVTSRYLYLLTIAIALSLFILLLLRQSVRSSVPLAPAILIPFLICYLAI